MDVSPRTGENNSVNFNGTRELSQTSRYVPTVRPTSDVDRLSLRLKTFSKWNGQKSALQLATAGFVYTGITDKVECESCGIRLYNWQRDEDPLKAHKKYAPDCEFMLKTFPQLKAPVTPKNIHSVKFPHYSDYETRLKSFDSWPLKCVAQKPEMMARSGFFYIGSADRARCFHCGVTLRDWDTDDYPPCAHRQWSENCPYVQEIDVEGMKAEIEEWERLERVKQEESQYIDCHSKNEIVVDGVSDASYDGTCFNPAIQAVEEMGYSRALIEKALEIRRKEGSTNPNAVSIFEAIIDMEA